MTSTIVSIGSAILAGLWASVLDASIFACLVVAAIRLAKPAAATRHVLYWLVLAVAIAAPVASIAASVGRVQTIADSTTSYVATAASPRASASTKTQLGDAFDSDGVSDAPEIDLKVPRSLLIGAALGIWLSVAFYKTIALCLEVVALHRVKRRAKALDSSRVAALRVWNVSAEDLRTARIALSNDVDVPCAAGLWSPSILLPESVVEKQSADDIDRIVMHEAAHLARYDDWTNVFERVLGAVLWFNPALAFTRGRITVDREIACDDWVVARMGGAHGYASCLFRLAEATTRSGGPAAHALGALGNTRHITERIEHLLSQPKLQPRSIARAVCATLGIAALAMTIVQATQAPAIAIDEQASPSETSATPVAPIATLASAAPIVAPTARLLSPIIAGPRPTPFAPRLNAINTQPTNREANLRAANARIAAANRALAIARRKIAAQQAELAHARIGIASDPSLSAIVERLKKLQSQNVFRFTIPKSARTENDVSRDVARGLSDARHEREAAERKSRDGMREAIRAQVEALRASAEAIRESNLGQAEVRRAMQEMRDELEHDGFLSGR